MKAFIKTVWWLILVLGIVACKEDITEADLQKEQEENTAILWFQSGMENETFIVKNSNGEEVDIDGFDTNFQEKNHWKNDLENKDLVKGIVSNKFEDLHSKTEGIKFDLVNDPEGSANRVLLLNAVSPDFNSEGKPKSPVARAQMSLTFEHEDESLTEAYTKFDMYLDPAIEKAWLDNPDYKWWDQEKTSYNVYFDMFEIWEHAASPSIDAQIAGSFRISTLLVPRPNDKQGFIMIAKAEDAYNKGYNRLWFEMNKEVLIPFGEWFTLEYYVKKGDKSSGQFWVSITKKDQEKQVLFDIQDFTQRSDFPAKSYQRYQPFKVYQEARQMLDIEGGVKVYYDNFELWSSKPY